MYLARVLVGEPAYGTRDAVDAPDRPDVRGQAYDSSCNGLPEPTIVVVHNDAQAYPEYLVTFREDYDGNWAEHYRWRPNDEDKVE
jgi:hypothetical protein